MARSSLLAGATVCLLVTAGCLGVLGGESPGPTPDASTPAAPAGAAPSPETPTPSTVRSPTPSSTPAVMPLPADSYGVGVGSPGQFADAHRAALENTSFTARYSYLERVTGSREIRTVGVVRYDGNGTVYYNYTTRRLGSDAVRRVELWSNGTVARRAATTPNGTVVRDARPVDSVRTFAGRVNLYLRVFRTGVTGYSRLGDESTVRISGSEFDRGDEADAIDGLAFRLGYGELGDGRMSAVVTGNTLLRYRVELNPTSEITIVEELDVTGIGTTTVTRPGWATGTNESASG